MSIIELLRSCVSYEMHIIPLENVRKDPIVLNI